MNRAGRALSVIAVFGVILGLFANPASASINRPVPAGPKRPAAVTSIVPEVIGLSDTYLSNGSVQQQYFWPATVTLDDSAPVSTLTDLHVNSPTSTATDFELDLRPAQGDVLHVGTYAHLDGTADPAEPTLTATVEDVSMVVRQTEVDILDLAADASGQITRFDLLVLFSADSAQASMFGEVRMGEPEATDHLLSNHAIKWPIVPVGWNSVPATEWLYNTGSGPMSIGRPTFTGSNADEFALMDSECPASLAAGDVCSFRVGFSPVSAGTASATMTVPVNGRNETVGLSGSSPTGLSELVGSGAGTFGTPRIDHRREGADLQFTETTTAFEYTFAETVRNLTGAGFWILQVHPPQGQKLAIGSFPVTAPFDNNAWWITATYYGTSGGCESYTGTLTVRQLEFNSDGSIARVDLSLVGQCDQVGPARVDFRYHSTVSYPMALRSGPSSVNLGAVVPISGTTAPGATVSVLFERRGSTSYVPRRTLTADANGHFSTSYTASDDYRYYVDMSGYLPVVGTTQVRPKMTAARSGPVVTLSGSAIPLTTVQLSFQVAGRPAVLRNVAVNAAGRWVRPYTANTEYLISVKGLANGLAAPTIRVKAS